MVKVESADATVAKVTALGGKAMPAFDIMDQGRMAVCFDPNGAAFDVWQAKQGPGMSADTSQHGAPSWFETMTTDVDRAAAFYAGLFGWTPEAMPMPGMTYTTFKLGADYVAGMMAITPEMGAMPPHWGTYFHRGRCRCSGEGGRRARRHAVRPAAGCSRGGPLLRHHVAAGCHVLRHQVRGLTAAIRHCGPRRTVTALSAAMDR